MSSLGTTVLILGGLALLTLTGLIFEEWDRRRLNREAQWLEDLRARRGKDTTDADH